MNIDCLFFIVSGACLALVYLGAYCFFKAAKDADEAIEKFVEYTDNNDKL